MRQSHLLQNTLRERPSEADTQGHSLLLRGGYVRQLAAGVYSYLPLGRRVLRKVEGIIREEMERADVQEVLLPSLQPAELWMESGRFATYGPNLMKAEDRHGRTFVLGPTHEEAVTWLLKNEVSSYKRLPVRVYQIGTKFRDELRPRSGLLRGREFIMKDAYSFDTTEEGLDRSYRVMYEAYHRIFARCGLDFRAVEADAGSIGGEGGSHEFTAISSIGEDAIAVCGSCGYAANVEQAETEGTKEMPEATESPSRGTAATPDRAAFTDIQISMAADREGGSGEVAGTAFVHNADQAHEPELFHTPGVRTIDQLVLAFGLQAADIIKTLIYTAGEETAAVLVRGDHEVNELKVAKYLGVPEVSLAEESAVLAAAGVLPGYVGPTSLKLPVTLLVDYAVAEMTSGIAGAGQPDYHLRGVVPGVHFALLHTGDLRNAAEGDICPRCRSGVIGVHKGIEIGHVFKLGTRYSEPLSASFLDDTGRGRPIIMGCYGIGVSRLVAAIAEQHAGEEGIAWPAELAPFDVHLIVVSMRDEAQTKLADELYEALKRSGAEVLLDDRQERPGVKFKDSELIGAPHVIVIGREAGEGRVEFEHRGTGGKETIDYREAIRRITE
ncbi:proline--tRNA ligase [Paenibacillus sp. HN-1]|uniref:proline--tRNA ligase n=1 Tax=Paenibacillus TaxID=44249 RepID=UPI001CA7D245|nr:MULTISPECIES: proline--tRNA ligase [Paenibacillus]MBY9082066.1 proline--tRNA ligase [Paenibacillus sp. CGMCC 1.18879]MBY9085776.1 proline--tRNA ligase [Paenibacillus sinensis]